MALQDMPLSDLQSAVSLNGADLFYVVQSGESKKVTLAVMIGNKADLENGLVPLRELPNSVVMVANDTERFALDSDEVNDGFIVLQYDSTHPEIAAKMFLVIDNTNLDSEAGYQPFAADAIWGNIINRPTNLAYLAGDDEELPSVSPVLRESSLQNNLVTTLPNYPLDARQGKVLDDKITAVNQNLTECVKKKTTADIIVPTATGRTIAQALNVLVNSSNYDISKVTPFSYIKNGVVFYRVSSITSNRVVFTYEAVGASVPTIISLYAQVGNNLAYSYNGTTVTAVGGETLSSALEFYY